MNNTQTILWVLILTVFFFQACLDNSKKSKENEIVLAFAEEMLNPDDSIYASYRENVDIYKRLLDFPFSTQNIQSSFDWHNDHDSLNLISMSELTRWNKQVEDYASGKIKGSEASSIFVDKFKDSGGYFEGNKFIGDSLKGKTYVISKPLIGRSSALIFYDLSLDINSLSGGSVIFQFKDGKWIKVASNTLVSTP